MNQALLTYNWCLLKPDSWMGELPTGVKVPAPEKFVLLQRIGDKDEIESQGKFSQA